MSTLYETQSNFELVHESVGVDISREINEDVDYFLSSDFIFFPFSLFYFLNA